MPSKRSVSMRLSGSSLHRPPPPAQPEVSKARAMPHGARLRYLSPNGDGARASGGCSRAKSLFGLARVLHRLLSVELLVIELAPHAFDLADVDVLNHVARLRVDHHLPARAFEDLALHGREQRIATALALGGLERLVD